MRAPMALSIAIAILAVLAGSRNVSAQDAIPETPPELRDFRLDPVRPAPQPQPEPPQGPEPGTETVNPPPAVSTVPERETAQPRPQPRREILVPRSEPQAASATSPQQAPVAEPPIGAVEPDTVADEIDVASPDPAPVGDTSATSVTLGQVLGALALVAITLLGVFLFRRRRKAADYSDIQSAESTVMPEHNEPAQLLVPMLPVAIPEPSSRAKKPHITLDFIPEKATLSFNMLTIKGQLRLINEGDAVAKGMELRAGLISASALQDKAIAAFHSESVNIKPESLGEAKVGERIGMAIELSVPLTDMQTFQVGDQKLLVPIMVANLAYGSDSKVNSEVAHIACMIGREANPPASKMGPLRLDLGPRSFASLGQRPLYA